ncbi:MAG: trehalose-phosphatase [Candidatus Omnitrophica bacterium]|jgi:alpha,alpha-trehalase|nr:trehalose-phosphatase [Candidatus Omnitrophota bacterium]
MDKNPFKAVIFDLDGVVTKTALTHAQAWKEVFDEYLLLREKRDQEPFKEFIYPADYLTYVDGKPRYRGVKSFLESRGISIPYGDPSDSFDKETICGLGNKKNIKFRQVLKTKGVQIYSSTISFIKKLKSLGIKIGVASSSKNCKYILEAANLENLFETRVDGEVSAQLGLKGKPESDIFTTASFNLGVNPAKAVVVEDASSGVLAGRNGGFGLVLGLARENNTKELFENGADLVVSDLSQLTLKIIKEWFHRKPLSLKKVWENKAENLAIALKNRTNNISISNPWYKRSAKTVFFSHRNLVFFLDYDGTLTPIAAKPQLAIISQSMKETVRKLAQKYKVAIVSGRARQEVQDLMGIEGIFYAGSHGFDIKGPGLSLLYPQAQEAVPLMAQIVQKLSKEIGSFEGILVEDKKFSVGVHYRLAKKEIIPKVKEAVEKITENNPSVHLMRGKKVLEILPAVDWNKGKAVCWLLQALGAFWSSNSVIYIGDDTTDEDAFRVVRTRGTGILVAEKSRISAADFILKSPKEVEDLFEKII